MEWIKTTEKMPYPGDKVYVVVQRQHPTNGKLLQFQTLAMFIAAYSVPYDDFMNPDYSDGSDADYSEELDEYYTPSGWYEQLLEPEVAFKITDQVTHWHPLLSKPAIIEPVTDQVAQ